MKLKTINRILGWFGLVLVVFVGPAYPTQFKVERVSTYMKYAMESITRK